MLGRGDELLVGFNAAVLREGDSGFAKQVVGRGVQIVGYIGGNLAVHTQSVVGRHAGAAPRMPQTGRRRSKISFE